MRKSTNTGKQMICVLENSQEETDMSEVYGLIRKLGATSKYKGFYYVAEAVRMAAKNSGTSRKDHERYLSDRCEKI